MLAAILTLAGIGLLSAVLLGVASRIFAIQTDPRLEQVLALLPGANCGACGFPGCNGAATAIVAGEAKINACAVNTAANKAAIAALLGQEFTATGRRTAFVHCAGGAANVQKRFDYQGVPSCVAADRVAGGFLDCRFGCLGLGDCRKACQFGAIVIEDGLAKIDQAKCTSCGMCLKACPRHLIDLQPEKQQVRVNCRNPERGKAVSSVCKVGCIACGRCAKACPVGAISMEQPLPVIDLEKCIQCGACARACPTGSIRDTGGPHYLARINENCTGCTLCARKCPAGAITGEKKERHTVDPKKCIYCHLCYEACNFEAIELVDEENVIRIQPKPKKKKAPAAGGQA